MISRSIIGKEIALCLQVSHKRGAQVADIVFDMITEDLTIHRQNVEIRGFGTFVVKNRAAREGLNPKTGEKIQIAAYTTVTFRPAKAMKDALNPKRLVGPDRGRTEAQSRRTG